MLYKRGGHKSISVFVMRNGFYEIQKDTIRENSSIIYHFITNNFSNIECIPRQLASTDMKIKEFKVLCNTVWSTKYKFITISFGKNNKWKI